MRHTAEYLSVITDTNDVIFPTLLLLGIKVTCELGRVIWNYLNGKFCGIQGVKLEAFFVLEFILQLSNISLKFSMETLQERHDGRHIIRHKVLSLSTHICWRADLKFRIMVELFVLMQFRSFNQNRYLTSVKEYVGERAP